MEITTESLENHKLRLTIGVDEERTQQAMHQAARQITKQVNIPGFRKGKAPYELVVQRFGEDTVRREAAEILVEAVYSEALKQEGIEPYAPAALDDIQLRPITFQFIVPLRPTVELGDYRAYRLDPPQATVPDQDVEQALEQIREQHAMLEQVERPAALDDGAVIDLAAHTAQGEEFLKGEGLRLLLDAASTDPAPGFAEAIVGMQAGDERTFTLTLPADFQREELRGQEAEFTVKMVEVYQNILPALDDDLARTAGNFDSLNALEAQVRQQLQQAVQGKADEQYTTQVLGAIVEQAQVEYPPVMLAEELDDMVKDYEQAVKRQARLSLEDYLRLQQKTRDDLRAELTPGAAARLRRALVLGEVIRLERLAVEEVEVSAAIEESSATWGIRADEVRASLNSDAGRSAVHNRLLSSKAVQRLVAIARGEAPELAPVEEAEEQGSEAAGEQGSGAAEEQETGSEGQEAGSEEAGSAQVEEG